MGFHVGIPTMKLANKVGGNASRKRTGTLRAVACEALEERWTKDPDVVRERTAENGYEGIRSGLELTERMTQEAEAYSQQRKAAGGRALRETASIGFVTIIKPDMEAIEAMTPEQREQFFRDSNEILDEILGRDNVRARVTHRDELGEHQHVFRMGFGPDGKLNVDSLVNPQTWRRVNLEYPQKMREKGWEVEDCEMYDAAKAEADPDYAEARRARRREYGRDSRKFKAAKDRERAEALDAREELAKGSEARLDRVRARVWEEQEGLDRQREELKQQQEKLGRQQRELDRQKQEQERQQRALEASRKAAEAEAARIKAEAAEAAREATEAVRKAVKGLVREEWEAAKAADRKPDPRNPVNQAMQHYDAAMEQATRQSGKILGPHL